MGSLSCCKSCLVIIATNVLIVLYFLSTCRKSVSSSADTVLQIREKLEIDETFPIVFYNTAFIDYRFDPPRLRVFSMNPCVTREEFIVVEMRTRRVRLRGEPTEGECPWHWASQCLYNSYIWSADVSLIDEDDEIVIHLNNRTVLLNVQRVHERVESGLTVCVQPVYFYSEFHNIALFIEAWRAQGASRFIVYFHSSTREVRMLLEYYRAMGLLTLKPWPSFGSLSPSVPRFHFPSFDSSTYRVGHTLAQNLCILEMSTEFGAIADFDEIIVSDGRFLLEDVRKTMKSEAIGALSFSHLLVKFDPKISTIDFSGVLNPVFLNRSGPSKTVFKRNSVDVIVTHSVRKFIHNETTARARGALLHFRHNSYSENAVEVRSELKLFSENGRKHVWRMQKRLDEVLGSPVPEYNSTYLHVLTECIDKIIGEGKCRSTVAYCRQWMEELTEWSYERSPTVFVV